MISPIQSRLIDAQLTPAALGTEISTAIAAKSLDAQKQTGAAILQLLDATQTIADSTAPPPPANTSTSKPDVFLAPVLLAVLSILDPLMLAALAATRIPITPNDVNRFSDHCELLENVTLVALRTTPAAIAAPV